MQPHRWKPTRLPRPWDSAGKNTGVGCHFLLQCMKVKNESEVAQSCPTLSDPMDCSLPGSSVHGVLQARELEWVAIAFSVSLLRDLKMKGSRHAPLPIHVALSPRVSPLSAKHNRQNRWAFWSKLVVLFRTSFCGRHCDPVGPTS